MCLTVSLFSRPEFFRVAEKSLGLKPPDFLERSFIRRCDCRSGENVREDADLLQVSARKEADDTSKNQLHRFGRHRHARGLRLSFVERVQDDARDCGRRSARPFVVVETSGARRRARTTSPRRTFPQDDAGGSARGIASLRTGAASRGGSKF